MRPTGNCRPALDDRDTDFFAFSLEGSPLTLEDMSAELWDGARFFSGTGCGVRGARVQRIRRAGADRPVGWHGRGGDPARARGGRPGSGLVLWERCATCLLCVDGKSVV